MNTALNNSLIDSYFKFFKKLDTASKKQLIIKLTESIDEPLNDSHDFSACFGAWQDDRNAQQISDDIRNERVNIKDLEDF